MKKFILGSLLVVAVFACSDTETDEGLSTTYLVTFLGNDTLAAEAYTHDGTTIYAKVVLRSPRTVLRNYRLVMDEYGMMTSLDVEWIRPASDSVFRTDNYAWDGDSLRMSRKQTGQEQTGAFSPSRDALPFIDMVHWPFDLMLSRVNEDTSTITQPLFSGTRTFNFVVARLSADSATLTHPSRGTMSVSLNEEGKLKLLDAGRTTRKLRVYKAEELDIESLALEFATRDAQGRSFGALSGRGLFEGTVAGVIFKIDYGTPAKRGREIWGKLVPFGERWRTGANRATHFSIDRDIMLGDVPVPAGDYTLFSFPEAEGGLLIINKQTGQNGRTYDEAQDLGRTKMATRPLDGSVEVFAITVDEETDGIFLKLQWDQTEYVIPVAVNPVEIKRPTSN